MRGSVYVRVHRCGERKYVTKSWKRKLLLKTGRVCQLTCPQRTLVLKTLNVPVFSKKSFYFYTIKSISLILHQFSIQR